MFGMEAVCFQVQSCILYNLYYINFETHEDVGHRNIICRLYLTLPLTIIVLCIIVRKLNFKVFDIMT